MTGECSELTNANAEFGNPATADKDISPPPRLTMDMKPKGKIRWTARYKPDMRKILWQTLLAPLQIPNMILSPIRIEWAAYNQSRFTKDRFSHRLLRELLKAGRFEGRKLSRDDIAKMYDERAAVFSVQAMRILEEFGGLRIGKHGVYLKNLHGDYDAAETVSKLLGSPLCPFGVTFYYCDSGGLWVDEQGRIFVTNGTNNSVAELMQQERLGFLDSSKAFTKALEYVAGSFVDALEFLAAGAKAPVWPVSTANKEGVWYFKDE